MNYFTFIFLRHAESVGNAEGLYQGQKDFPLTKRGINQVKRLISRWQADGTQIDRVVSSPLERAQTTAKMICEAFNWPLELDEDWQERNLGVLTGLGKEEAEKVLPKPDFFTPFSSMGKTGEGNWALYMRAGRAIHKILQRPPERYLIVSHGGLLNQLMHVILGIAPQANDQGVHFRFINTAFARFYYEPDRHKWTVWGLNDFTHLAVKDFSPDEEEEL
jgi:broad specificity phosphatase PhoE